MPTVIAIAVLAILVLLPLLLPRRASGDQPWVRVETGGVAVGRGKDRGYIPIPDIHQIRIAPLRDVYPFDDCWLLASEAGDTVSFLGRESGAAAVLAHLEHELPNFSATQSVKKANDESIFEEPVVVWCAL